MEGDLQPRLAKSTASIVGSFMLSIKKTMVRDHLVTTEVDLDILKTTHSRFDTYAISFSEENRCKVNIGRGQDRSFLGHRQESKQIREQRNMLHPIASKLNLGSILDRQV